MPDDIDLKKVGEIGVSPIKVRLTPTEDVIIDVSKTKKVTVIGLEPEAINSASAQKGSGMPSIKTLLSWGAALALVAWVAAGMYYYYGKTPDPPLFWIFGSAQENRLEAALQKKQQLANNTVIDLQFNGLTSNGPIRAPIDRQPGPPPQSGQWEEADNSAIQVPAGWTLNDQGPSCPSGTHRVATGKIKTLPNGDVMAQEICQ